MFVNIVLGAEYLDRINGWRYMQAQLQCQFLNINRLFYKVDGRPTCSSTNGLTLKCGGVANYRLLCQ